MGCGASSFLGGQKMAKAAATPTAKTDETQDVSVLGGSTKETDVLLADERNGGVATQEARGSLPPLPLESSATPTITNSMSLDAEKQTGSSIQPFENSTSEENGIHSNGAAQNRSGNDDVSKLIEKSFGQELENPDTRFVADGTVIQSSPQKMTMDIDDLEWAELKEEKQKTVHLQLINQDGTDMFCSFDTSTNFWQIASKVRSAYGEQICFLSPKTKEPLSSQIQFSGLLEEYKLSKDKHLVIHTKTIGQLDMDDIDEFEDVYEDKKIQVFIRYSVDKEEPIDCIFPLPFSFFQLKDQFRGGRGGGMYISAWFGTTEETFLRDDNHFQQILREYQISYYKYLNLRISQHVIKDVDDEDEQLLMDKQIEVHQTKTDLHFSPKLFFD